MEALRLPVVFLEAAFQGRFGKQFGVFRLEPESELQQRFVLGVGKRGGDCCHQRACGHLVSYFFFQNLAASSIFPSAFAQALAPAACRALNQPTANHARASCAVASR